MWNSHELTAEIKARKQILLGLEFEIFALYLDEEITFLLGLLTFFFFFMAQLIIGTVKLAQLL